MTASREVSTLPPTLAANPRLSRWLRILPEGAVEVRAGRVELGQGVLTALAQVAAEELDVDMTRIRVIPATTGLSPDEGYTAGSMSIQYGAAALRVACAEARGRYLAAASAKAQRASGHAHRDRRRDQGPGRRVHELLGARRHRLPDTGLLDVDATGEYPPKPASAYRIVGTSVPRLDLPAKVTGRPRYVHDLALEGLCYGQVVRPPSRGATLESLDQNPASSLAGVITVVRDGDFLAVVAERFEVALRAAAILRDCADMGAAPDAARLGQPARLPALRAVGDDRARAARRSPAATDIAASLEATYHRPYLAHASLAPSSATARYDDGQLRVWTHSQGVYPLRGELARALSLAVGDVTVTHAEGAGCYGHNGADDVALDASLLAMAVPGRPVQVTWSRPDELGWAPFGTAGVVRVAAEPARTGASCHGATRSGATGTRAGPARCRPCPCWRPRTGRAARPSTRPWNRRSPNGGGAGRNAVPYYDFPAHEVVNHRLLEMPLRTSALRSLGSVPQRVRGRVVHGRARGRRRPGSRRVPAVHARRLAGPAP